MQWILHQLDRNHMLLTAILELDALMGGRETETMGLEHITKTLKESIPPKDTPASEIGDDFTFFAEYLWQRPFTEYTTIHEAIVFMAERAADLEEASARRASPESLASSYKFCQTLHRALCAVLTKPQWRRAT